MAEKINIETQQGTIFDPKHDTDEMAHHYDASHQSQYKLGLALAGLARIARGDKVLDIGCGPGNLTSHLAELVGNEGHVLGVDVNEKRISIALKLEEDYPNLTFSVGNAEEVSQFGKDRFDVVFVNATIHWVDDTLKALKAALYVLKPGGRIVISTACGDHIPPVLKIRERILLQQRFQPYRQKEGKDVLQYFKKNELDALLSHAGFRDIDTFVTCGFTVAEDEQNLLEKLETSASGNFLLHLGLPAELLADVQEAIKQELKVYRTNKGIRIERQIMMSVGKKPQ
jgi:arsenite methyltransferase